MGRSRGWGFSAEQKRQIWAWWKAGQTASVIGRALQCNPGTVFHQLASDGGIARAPRRRRPTALTAVDREEITRGLAAGIAPGAIARTLHRARSTITREIRRNGGRLDYRAGAADAAMWTRAKRPQRCRLATDARLCAVVAAQLREDWSPGEIAARLVIEYPDERTMRVSHETIYRTLYIQARGALKKDLVAHLRRRHAIRRPRRDPLAPPRASRIPDAVSIAARPPEIEDRAVPGHWEGDLLAGAGNTHIGTLVERKSRFVQLIQVAGKDTTSVVDGLIREVQRLPAGLMRTLTWDRGTEMVQHHRFSVATDVAVYFCDPQSPWQRGSNENTNGLLRQYFPKGMRLAHLTQADLDAVADRLNRRPRQTLGFRTPAEQLALDVAATS
ncbi:MAG TPA: IS30 family transposase [Gemmatimonadaceae bacterium]|nr:IS30 family transposase [Gemmatimonadaceae bacterium]